MEQSCWWFSLLCTPPGERPQAASVDALYSSREEWTSHNGTHKPVTRWKAARGATLQLRPFHNSAKHQLQAISREVEVPCRFGREELPPSSSPLLPALCSTSSAIPAEWDIKGETTFFEFPSQMTVLEEASRNTQPTRGTDVKYGLCILMLLFYTQFRLRLLSGSWPVTSGSSWKSKRIIIMRPACYLWNPVCVLQHVINVQKWCLNNAMNELQSY